jgi:hypothetical protein
MDHKQSAVYEPYASTRTGYPIQDDDHPELATDEQLLIEKLNARRRKTKAPSIGRLGTIIRGITLCTAITVLVIQSIWLSVWFRTRDDIMADAQGHFKPKAWPTVIDVKPTYTVVAVAVITILFQLSAILTHVGPVSAKSSLVEMICRLTRH